MAPIEGHVYYSEHIWKTLEILATPCCIHLPSARNVSSLYSIFLSTLPWGACVNPQPGFRAPEVDLGRESREGRLYSTPPGLVMTGRVSSLDPELHYVHTYYTCLYIAHPYIHRDIDHSWSPKLGLIQAVQQGASWEHWTNRDRKARSARRTGGRVQEASCVPPRGPRVGGANMLSHTCCWSVAVWAWQFP